MTVIEIFTQILVNAGMIAISIAAVMMIEDLNDKRLQKKDKYDGVPTFDNRTPITDEEMNDIFRRIREDRAKRLKL